MYALHLLRPEVEQMVALNVGRDALPVMTGTMRPRCRSHRCRRACRSARRPTPKHQWFRWVRRSGAQDTAVGLRSSALELASRRNTTAWLFAGIATTASRSRPRAAQSAVTSVSSRTPHAGIPLAERRVEGHVARRGQRPADAERPVEEEHAARREHPRGAAHEPLARGPGRDVDHVDGDDDIGVRHGPGLGGGVEHEGRAQVREGSFGAPGFDAGEGGGVRVGGLPDDVGELAGEEHRMLAGAARHLEDHGARGREGAEDVEDRAAVSAASPARLASCAASSTGAERLGAGLPERNRSPPGHRHRRLAVGCSSAG